MTNKNMKVHNFYKFKAVSFTQKYKLMMNVDLKVICIFEILRSIHLQ